MKKFIQPAAVAATLALAMWTSHAQANLITTLFNTGVDSFGNVLAENQTDPHYTLTAGPILGAPIVATSSNAWPVAPNGPWIGDNTISAWIAPTTDTSAPTDTYVYTTTFDLTGFDFATANIDGLWAQDDVGSILLNGVMAVSASGGYSNFDTFAISSGFIAGVNTLDFVVVNSGGGPTGLRVEMTGTAKPIKEPVTLALFCTGLLGIAASYSHKHLALAKIRD